MKNKSKIGYVLLVSIIVQLIIFVFFGVLDEMPLFLGMIFLLLFPTNIVLFILYIIRKIKGWKISNISKCEEKTFTGIAKEKGKIALETAMILQNLYEIIKKESPQIPAKDKTYLLFRIKDQSTRNNCSTEDIKLFEQRIKERTTTIGYELTTGRIIGSEAGKEWEDTSKIVVSINQNDIIKVDYQNEINLKQINETLTKIETLIKNKYNKQIEINYIIRDKIKAKGEKIYLEISEKDKPIWWEDPGIVNTEKLDVMLTDELIEIVEQKLKHKLPKKYLELLNSQNGGRLIRRYYYFSKNDRIFEIDSIYGVSDNFEHGIVEENIIASDWSDYINLNNNIVFGGDISAGHAHYLFDYTDLNEVGEPKIIWYDNELDEKILLANSFEEFIDNLKSKEGIESCIYEPEKISKNVPYEYDIKYNGVNIVIDFNIEASQKHLLEDYKVLEKEGIENIIKNQFIFWLKGEEFRNRDNNKIYEGLKVHGINYHYSKIIDKYSPTGEENYFGKFEFEFESSSDYTNDMLEAVTMEVYVLNGKIVKVSGYDI